MELDQQPPGLQGHPGVSRRGLLRMLGAAPLWGSGALAVMAPPVQDPPAPDPPVPGEPAEPAAGPVPTVRAADPVVHLLSRATFGATAALVADVRERGAATWLAEQLDPDLDDGGIEAVLAETHPQLARTAGELVTPGEPTGDQAARAALGQAAVLRQLYSRRQLFERMVEFWTDHLNVPALPTRNHLAARKLEEDREVIRAHALGRFADLLAAQATSPAMLGYLSQEESRGDGDQVPNENYARELMEIHTLGVEAGYTEDDVKNAARLLTGLTTDNAPDAQTYVYRPEWHAVGPVTVLDFSSANDSPDGEAEALRFVDHLAHHPSTAQRLARRLVQRFVAEDPPATLVDRLAQVYLDGDTQIAPVLQALFESEEFAESVGQKVTRPNEDLLGAIRALGFAHQPRTERPGALTGALRRLGMEPFQHPSPYGYAIAGTAWVDSGNLYTRWNLHQALVAGDYDDVLEPAADVLGRLLDPAPATVGDLVDAAALHLVHQPLAPAHRDALIVYTARDADDPVADAAARDGLLRRVVPTLLRSPYSLQR